MALFFDARWFDERLAALGLERATLAAAAGMSAQDLTLAFKDQREVSPAEVRAFAALLAEAPEEVARRCGVTTRPAPESPPEARLAALEGRLDRMEAQVAALLKRLDDQT